ncbi:MAG: hypothetical protein WBO46_27225 [Caldilineaceae bacterium]
MLTLQSVAKEFSLPEEVILQQSLKAFLVREISLIEAEIAQLRERYTLVWPNQLKQAISEGRIVAHPAWEDYIDWQNSIEAMESIRSLLTESESSTPIRPAFCPETAQ